MTTEEICDWVMMAVILVGAALGLLVLAVVLLLELLGRTIGRAARRLRRAPR